MTTTTNFLDTMLYVRDGFTSARWNFPLAVGSPVSDPAGMGAAASVTYTFLTSAPSYAPAPGFAPLDAAQQSGVVSVLAQYSQVARLTFAQQSDGALTFGIKDMSGTSLAGAYAYASPPGYGTTSSFGGTIIDVTLADTGGDVWLNDDYVWAPENSTPGHYGYLTLMHEIGHAMGLRHPFEVTQTTGLQLDPSLDSTRYTVMSYTQASQTTIITVSGTEFAYSWSVDHVYATSLMMFDIAAVQALYGANAAGHTGNTTYHWSTNQELLETIWDGAGTADVIDCSNQVFTCNIDLRAGNFSSIGERLTQEELKAGLDIPSFFNLSNLDPSLLNELYDGKDNLAIAYGTTIENAIGGSGNDRLDGNSVANRLTGGLGNDSLFGREGNDTLDGGGGADAMTGGTGNDLYDVRNGTDTVVELAGEGTDTVYSFLASWAMSANVEVARIISAGTAGLTGNELGNTIYAGKGNNAISGGAGTDLLSYAYGLAGATGVTVSLATASAQATGGSGTDTITGFENLTGSALADRLTGSSAANTLHGGAGNDRLLGGSGNDIVYGDGGNDSINGGVGTDKVYGGAGNDVFDFARYTELTVGTAADTIADFVSGQDRISLAALDSNIATTTINEAFTFVGSSAFNPVDATAQLRYEYFADLGYGVLSGSNDADTAPEFEVRIAGAAALQPADLVL